MSLPGRESLSSIRELARRQTYFPSRVDYTGLPGLKREKERAKSTSDSLPRRAGGERTAPPASSRPAAIWRARRPLPPPVSAALRERSPPAAASSGASGRPRRPRFSCSRMTGSRSCFWRGRQGAVCLLQSSLRWRSAGEERRRLKPRTLRAPRARHLHDILFVGFSLRPVCFSWSEHPNY